MTYAELIRKHKEINSLSMSIARAGYGSDIVLSNNKYLLKVSAKIKSKENLKEIVISKYFEINLKPLKIPTLKTIQEHLTTSIKEYYD